MNASRKTILVLSVLFFSLCGSIHAQDDRAALRAQHQVLQEKVATLKQEQDFLLFQKEMYGSDSKYLVINITKKSGQLKYKNRVLKNFLITTPKRSLLKQLQQGKRSLTKKTADQKDRFTLLFGTSFALQWKRDRVSYSMAGMPVFSLAEKEMFSIFLALEEGALAYILR